MNVYYNDRFTGVHPVGTCAIVVAKSAPAAAKQLEEALTRQGLRQPVEPRHMIKVPTDRASAVIVNNGDY